MPDDKAAPRFIGLKKLQKGILNQYLLGAPYSGSGQLTVLNATEAADKQVRVPAFYGQRSDTLLPREHLPGGLPSPSLHSPEIHLN